MSFVDHVEKLKADLGMVIGRVDKLIEIADDLRYLGMYLKDV